MKNVVVVLVVFTLAYTQTCIGQESDSISRIGLSVISQANQGNSYITFPTDIGNIEPLWFEGNIIPNFYLRQSKNSRLMGVLTPQIIIRMYQEESKPVRTPSYMPQITVYYNFKENRDSPDFSMYGRVTHHSNGQDGDFFLENGELNLKNGSFSTNFLELGLITTNVNKRFNAYQFFKTSFEVHPEAYIQDELKGIYSQYRWHTAFSIFKLPDNKTANTRKNADISVKGEATWLFGELNNWNYVSLNRLNISLTFYYHPRFLEDIGLFVQYYHGLDYYNMYFSHQLDVLRFGFMTEKLRF
ncbi:MAG: hypothetical protein A2W97_13895 [Bacteroidetes bacterium GWE2_40_63]|nr:MAG: hypothetical protein A2W84_12380 [Bacteroidetes bacterium GWC2_40_13]OFX73815.1 MAG: hypothetical protein A2W96_08075 [Bacteroidetes bacterium GWD2_40_43]OFX89443.1 MAG: hypothetical protein A2W97_13895 [Bacteroidetes bacterium GWE2_40_63]OFY23269.1 MAG: hypothetical protein A2W88_19555 [Bacteroidetes bacterium GWF2_40_13]OFZ28122.1 MAG: hypothetical protein A2437_04440 [Bacteroidetes bacterium RIFOXYC2_FULL_40_12]